LMNDFNWNKTSSMVRNDDYKFMQLHRRAPLINLKKKNKHIR